MAHGDPSDRVEGRTGGPWVLQGDRTGGPWVPQGVRGPETGAEDHEDQGARSEVGGHMGR